MKHYLFLISTFFILSLTSKAERPSLHLGLGGGFNANVINLKLLEGVVGGYRVGYHAGFFLRVSEKRLYQQINVDFIRTTHTIYIKNDLDDTNNQIGWWGVDLPVVVGYKVINSPILKWRFFGGITTRIIGHVDDVDDFGAGPEDHISPHWNLRMGTGFDIAFFYIDFNYGIGLNKVYKLTPRSQSHDMALTMGFLF
jgi:hypothetical protein